MLIIKSLMFVASLVFFSYFFVAARGRPLEKIGMSLVFASIAFFALFHELSDRVANFVGVDRGADLGVYLATMTLLFLCFNLYLRQRQLQGELRAVVRTLGLMTARGRPSGEAADLRTDRGSAGGEPAG